MQGKWPETGKNLAFGGRNVQTKAEPGQSVWDAEEGNWIDLQNYVTRFGIDDRSLQKIYANLFGQKISKSQRLSNWEAETLTESQMRYAATDAWACVEIYRCLDEMERTGDYELIQVETTAVITESNKE